MINYITIGNTRIWTTINDVISTEKPFLCLCGGGPGISDYLSDMDNLLCELFNIIRWEQRGCGNSTADGNYSIETAIEDLNEIKQYYNIETWYLAGHSWGAELVLAYSLKYKYNCTGLI